MSKHMKRIMFYCEMHILSNRDRFRRHVCGNPVVSRMTSDGDGVQGLTKLAHVIAQVSGQPRNR